MLRPEHTPTVVRAPRAGDTVEIDWADGHAGKYPNAMLRGYCPCAGCQGHSGEIRFVSGNNAVIESIDEIGSYALCFTWGDGHNSGIYSFQYLRSLCACDACRGANARPPGAPLPRT